VVDKRPIGPQTKARSPFRDSSQVIQLVLVLYVRYPLSLKNVEDLVFEHGIDICHETVRTWVNRFGPMFDSRLHHSKKAECMYSNFEAGRRRKID
jgi:transposase-like protein